MVLVVGELRRVGDGSLRGEYGGAFSWFEEEWIRFEEYWNEDRLEICYMRCLVRSMMRLDLETWIGREIRFL